MPRLKSLFHATCLGLALNAPALQAQAPGAMPALRAGQWQIRSGTVGQPTAAYGLCFKTGGAEDLKLLLPQVSGNSACPAPEMRSEGAELQWNLSCPEAGLSISARYSLRAEHVEGTVQIVSGKPPRQRTDRISADYAGPCPPP
ncbi:MAG: hypothetical protein JWN73_4030 [Betaproteobacteria bacterium]|nr:hypothetical protein [Betaproteobacteria bacterium]